MSSVVLKIKYGQSLRRLVVPTLYNSLVLTFAQLEAKIREYFSIPASSKLLITYVDQDGDSVTLAEDQELQDACLVQLLNPLRLLVSVEQQEEEKTPEVAAEGAAAASSIKSALEGINDELKPVLQAALRALDDDASLRRVLGPVLPESGFISDILQSISKRAAAAGAAATGESSGANGTTEAGAAAAPEAPKAWKGAAADGSKGAGLSSEAPPSPAPEINSEVYHYNVQCDACGLCPIVGPRFKSLVKHDYDLCLSCFNQQPEGREAQYKRQDRPLPVKGWAWTHARAGRGAARAPFNYSQQYRCPFNRDAFNRDGFWSSDSSSRWGSGSPNWGSAAAAAKPEFKPDSRFVCDVTIPDGTAVTPGTRLVKIWRLRNSGRCSWPCDTRLIRAGGDQLGAVSAVALEMPSDAGLAPGAEVEVAVDLVAPEKAGRYVSYWRLMTPGGLKFGHRVWAMIQVTQAPEAAAEAAVSPAPNTKPGDREALHAPEAEAIERAGALQAPVASGVLDEPENGGVVEVRVVAETAPVVVVVEAEIPPPPKEAVMVVSDEEGVDADESVEGFSLVEAPREEGEGKSFAGEDSESSLMDGFLGMGFSDKSLISEFLAKNGNDFQKTLDDLVSAADWDPILVELEEMGFYDAQMNRRLMVKNNGSVKRVVKELVQMYKDPASNN